MDQVSKPELNYNVSSNSSEDSGHHMFAISLHHQLTVQEVAMIEDALKMMLPWIIKGVLSL